MGSIRIWNSTNLSLIPDPDYIYIIPDPQDCLW